MILFLPFAGMQEQLLACTEFEAFAGGAAGPGKSLALLVDGLRYIGHKSYRALILRSSYPELQELMDRADEIFPDLGGIWNENDKRWTFPSGATYEFGYLTFFAEVKRYRGQEYAYVGYDEIGDLAEERTWTFLATRCRTKDRRIPPRVRCTANPGGIAHAWLRRRFIVTCGEDGRRVFVDPKTGLRRRFLPGRLTENPALLANNPDYVKQIRSNPDIIVRQLEHGDWNAGTGAALDELSESRHIIPAIPIPKHWRTWGAFDWGFRHPFAYGLFAQNEDGDVYLVDSVHGRLLLDEEIVSRIAEHFKALVLEGAAGVTLTLGNMLPRFTVAGHDCWHDIKARSESGPTTADTFAKAKIPLMRANISRVSGLKNLRSYLAWRGKGVGGGEGTPRFRMFDTPGNRKVFGVLESMVSDPDNQEDVLKLDADSDGSGGDDAYDMVRYSLQQYPIQVKAPEVRRHDPQYDSGFDRMMARATAAGRTRRGF